jgi:hypothetical protein
MYEIDHVTLAYSWRTGGYFAAAYLTAVPVPRPYGAA